MRFIILFLLIASPVFADTIVYVDKDTSEVISISEDSMKLSNEDKVKWKKVVLDKNIKDLGLKRKAKDYLLINGDFIENNAKISKEANDRVLSDNINAEMALISMRMKKIACLDLKKEGTVFSYINCDDF